jgi:hypothetical protein
MPPAHNSLIKTIVPEKSTRKKRPTALLIVLGIIVAALVVGYFQFDTWVERLVRTKLTALINQNPNGVYEYKFESLNINLVTGSMVLREIGLIPTNESYDSIKSVDSPLRSIMSIEVDKIEMNGFEIRKFIKTGELEIAEFIIREPLFKLYFNADKRIGNSRKAELFSEILTDQFKGCKLETFNIIDGTLSIKDIQEDRKPLTVKYVDLVLTNAKADASTINNFIPFEFEDISFVSAGIYADISDEFLIESESLQFQAADQFFKLSNFQIRPKYSQAAFSANFPNQKQWFAITIEELELYNIDIDKLYETGSVEIAKIITRKPNIGLYKDKSKPMPPFKKKPLPATAIREILWPIHIDTIQVRSGLITINEKSDLTMQVSNFTLDNLSADIYRFTNDTMKIDERILSVELKADLMNAAPVKVNMLFDLNDRQDNFSVVGHLDSVSATIFNPVLLPTMAVNILAGEIHAMDFSFSAMDTLAIGTLDIEYENLKIEVLDPESKKPKKQGFMSFAANTVIKTHNNKNDNHYIQGIIKTNRVLEKDVFPYLWHAIESGLITTIVPISNTKETKKIQKEARNQRRKENREDR